MPTLIGQKYISAFAITLAAFAAGCSDSRTPVPKMTESLPASVISTETPSTVVGTPPAGPTAEATGTTSAVKSDVSKTEQSNAMPMPGQANDHSTLSPAASQKSGSIKK